MDCSSKGLQNVIDLADKGWKVIAEESTAYAKAWATRRTEQLIDTAMFSGLEQILQKTSEKWPESCKVK